MGDKAMAGEELQRSMVRLVAAVIALSVEEWMGITACVGNHTSVSAMQYDLVSHI